jgi:hypothetical protein
MHERRFSRSSLQQVFVVLNPAHQPIREFLLSSSWPETILSPAFIVSSNSRLRCSHANESISLQTSIAKHRVKRERLG